MMTTESVASKTSDSTNGTSAVPKATPDVAATVARLRQTFATGRTRDIEWRKQQLLQLQKLMEENEAAIADALAEDLDRSPFEAFIADIATTIGEAKYAAKKVRSWTRRKYRLLELPQLPGRGWIEYEPYGTVMVIGAWNYPFYLTLGPAVGAIAAGNAVILKPSEIAAASAHLMAELVPRYLDNDAIAVVEGDGAVSQELIAQGLDRVLFTGGTEIGRKVYEGGTAFDPGNPRTRWQEPGDRGCRRRRGRGGQADRLDETAQRRTDLRRTRLRHRGCEDSR
jgi:aldehyde dehydrogenase (NAD+)